MISVKNCNIGHLADVVNWCYTSRLVWSHTLTRQLPSKAKALAHRTFQRRWTSVWLIVRWKMLSPVWITFEGNSEALHGTPSSWTQNLNNAPLVAQLLCLPARPTAHQTKFQTHGNDLPMWLERLLQTTPNPDLVKWCFFDVLRSTNRLLLNYGKAATLTVLTWTRWFWFCTEGWSYVTEGFGNRVLQWLKPNLALSFRWNSLVPMHIYKDFQSWVYKVVDNQNLWFLQTQLIFSLNLVMVSFL